MKLLPSLILLALAPATIGVAQDVRLLAGTQSATDAVEARLGRALDAITAEKLSSDLHFIASDELGGRDSPSPGLRVAAEFIRTRMERLGLEHGAPEGYTWEYTLPVYGLNAESTGASAARGDETLPLKFGEDYYLTFRNLGEREATGPLVFGGHLSEEELGDVELEGKWVLCHVDDGISQRRMRTALEGGALGLVVAPGPAYDGQPFSQLYGRWTSRMVEPSMRRMARGSGTAVVYVTDAAEGELLALAGVESPTPGQELGIEFSESCQYGPLEPAVLENVCALWPGSDPELRNEVIILSAHYDHVGERENGDIYNGADDNGSGTTGLMALADALTKYGPMRRTVLLMWVSAEEKGLLGSRAWTKNPWLPEGMRPLCNINIDMIGRNAPDEILFTPSPEHPAYSGLSKVFERNMGKEGFTTLKSADSYWQRSDQYNFSVNLKIPVAFLFADVHEDYHQPTDTPDKIDYDKQRRIVRLVMRMLVDLQADVLDL